MATQPVAAEHDAEEGGRAASRTLSVPGDSHVYVPLDHPSIAGRNKRNKHGGAPLACWAAGIALRLRARGAAHSQRVRWAARASRDGHTFGRFGRFCALRMLRRPLGLWARAAWLRAGAMTPCAYLVVVAFCAFTSKLLFQSSSAL